MKMNHTLAGLNFGNIIGSYQGTTSTGIELLEKYQGYLMNNPESIKLVNEFIKEANNCIYDKEIEKCLSEVCEYLNKHKVSWQLASVCESIENDNRQYSFLNKAAVNQIRALLEWNDEAKVIQGIKAGVLKNVMYVESLRNIAKSVYNNREIKETFDNYTITHPFGIIECKGNDKFFAVGNSVYRIDESGYTSNDTPNNVSIQFKNIMNFINSNKLTFENETLSYQAPNYKVTITEAGFVNKTTDDGKTIQYTVEQFRDNANVYLKGYMMNNKAKLAYDIEILAQISENFDNFCVLDNVNIITSNNNQFVLVEANNNGTYGLVESISSRVHSPFKMEGNILECVSFIKSRCNIDLTTKYENEIDLVVESEEKKSALQMEHEIELTDVEKRRKKITEMAERFKNDPVKLQVLNKIALSLNEMEK